MSASFFKQGDRVTFARPSGDDQTVLTLDCDGEVVSVESADQVVVRWDDGAVTSHDDNDLDLV